MKAKLIAHTTHPEMSPEEFIAYCARVSNPSNQNNFKTSDKLLGYLIRNSHWSPFEMSHAVIEINTTRDIARQILRHRSFSFQEFSQRYSNIQELGLIHNREPRLQDYKNRQNSIPIDDETLHKWFQEAQSNIIQFASDLYDSAIQRGIAKEQARVFLPEGLTNSRLYMAGTIRSWIHYIDLRTSKETQKEHRLVAEACKKELATIYPILFGTIHESKN